MAHKVEPGDLVDYVMRLRRARAAMDAVGFASDVGRPSLEKFGVDAETVIRCRQAAERAGELTNRLIQAVEATKDYKTATKGKT